MVLCYQNGARQVCSKLKVIPIGLLDLITNICVLGEAPQSNSGAKVSAAGSTDSLTTTSSQCTVATTTVKIEDFGSHVTDSQAGQGQPPSAAISDTPGSQGDFLFEIFTTAHSI